MDFTLFTIGFTKKTAEEFFRLLQEADIRKIFDIRENRGGQLAGFAKYPDIAFFVHRLLGIEYVPEPLWHPPRRYARRIGKHATGRSMNGHSLI